MPYSSVIPSAPEDVFDALRQCVVANPKGYTQGEFAKKRIWPTKAPDVAKNTLSQILNGTRGVVLDELVAILDGGDPAPVIRYLCHRYSYRMPDKAPPVDVLAATHERLEEIANELAEVRRAVMAARPQGRQP